MDASTPIPFGRKKGTPLGQLSNGYLTTLYLKQYDKLPQELREYIEQTVPLIRFKKEQQEREEK